MPYSPNVERWRSIVAKYVPAELVDKVLYTIQGESGGNPEAVGDGGNAIGLLQIHHGGSIKGRPDAKTLLDPEQNIKYAAEQLGMAGGNFAAWGENNLYQGKPFGALGNNPYPGTVTNGRAPVGGAIKSVPEQAEPSNTNPSLRKLNSMRGQPIAKSAKAVSTGTKTYDYQPTGVFEDDTGGYWQQAQDAYSEYQKYKNSSADILFEDEDAGKVYRYVGIEDPNSDEEGRILDPQGTRILQKALTAEKAIDRLLAAKKAGLIDTGEGAAAAYLTSQKERKADTASDYEEYIKRVSDLIAIEDVPLQRAAQLASTMATVAKTARDSGRTYTQGMGTAGQSPRTNLQPIAASMRSALPASAPMPYNIDPSAFAPSMSASGMRIPARKPEEVLAEAGIQPVDPSMLPGPPQDFTPGTYTMPGAQTRTVPNVPTQSIGPRTNPSNMIEQVLSGILGKPTSKRGIFTKPTNRTGILR